MDRRSGHLHRRGGDARAPDHSRRRPSLSSLSSRSSFSDSDAEMTEALLRSAQAARAAEHPSRGEQRFREDYRRLEQQRHWEEGGLHEDRRAGEDPRIRGDYRPVDNQRRTRGEQRFQEDYRRLEEQRHREEQRFREERRFREGEAGPVNHRRAISPPRPGRRRNRDEIRPGRSALETIIPGNSGIQPEFIGVDENWAPQRAHEEEGANAQARSLVDQFLLRMNAGYSRHTPDPRPAHGHRLANGYRLPLNIAVSEFYSLHPGNSDRVRSIIRSFYPNGRPPLTTFMIIDRPRPHLHSDIRVIRFGGFNDRIRGGDVRMQPWTILAFGRMIHNLRYVPPTANLATMTIVAPADMNHAFDDADEGIPVPPNHHGHGPAQLGRLQARRLVTADFSNEGPTRCGICFDDKQQGDEVTTLPCAHWFDRECIEHWLRSNNSCPTCRNAV